MGCGSSSLKGETPSGIEPAPQPVKKVRTDFTDIDYDQEAKKRRMTEYAPHETPRNDSTRPESSADASAVKPPERADTAKDEAGPMRESNLQPYYTLEDERDGQSYPHEKGTSSNQDGTDATDPTTAPDPTSSTAKDTFATANDPANPSNQDPTLQPPTDDADKKGRKKSWFGKQYERYESAKSGRNKEVSDEEMKKYTGMTNEEMKEFARSGGRGVGRGQAASAGLTPGVATGMTFGGGVGG